MRRRRIAQLLSASLAAFAIPFAIVVGVLVTVVAAYDGTATANRHGDLRNLAYGYPMAWVHQDQHQYSPPQYPQKMELDNPMDSQTSIEPGRLFGDIAIVGGVTLGAFLVIAAGIRLAGGRKPQLA